MLGLALLTILLLVWNARRVHKRGQFGHMASAASRSLYPIVLGLGGRCFGALITAILGAAAGGSLLLLTFDVSQDRQVSDQPALLTLADAS
jgi:hypothetical protein